MENMFENRTMPIVLAELNDSVDKYNMSADAVERAQLAAKHKELTAEYNELSLLNAYATFMADEAPLVALAKTVYYKTVNTKDTAHNEVIDGVKKSSVTRSVKESDRRLDVVKFVEWTEERNKSVAYAKDWKSKVGAARSSIVNEWKKFFASGKDTHSMSIGKTKRAIQAMFDALVFIPCENDKDKNAVIATGNIAKFVLAFANECTDGKNDDGKVVITGSVIPDKIWKPMLLRTLHLAVEGKDYDITYNEPEDEEIEAEEAEVEPDTKPAGKKSGKK